MNKLVSSTSVGWCAYRMESGNEAVVYQRVYYEGSLLKLKEINSGTKPADKKADDPLTIEISISY
ncbi:hypothetical protein GCM10028808_45370 [Spirosoma migulaei]